MLLSGKRIFVVEDNLENRVIVQMILGLHGAVIEFDRWGRDTTHKLASFAPVDLILLDLMFPHGVTGYDIFDTIRRNRAYDFVPIIAVSASDPASAIPRCQEKGFAGFISKLIATDLFPAQLEQIMQGQQVWYSL